MSTEYEDATELCKRLKIGRATLSRLMKKGLPHIKLGHKLLRFPIDEVNAWLESDGGSND